jgi:hypothetical protein
MSKPISAYDDYISSLYDKLAKTASAARRRFYEEEISLIKKRRAHWLELSRIYLENIGDYNKSSNRSRGNIKRGDYLEEQGIILTSRYPSDDRVAAVQLELSPVIRNHLASLHIDIHTDSTQIRQPNRYKNDSYDGAAMTIIANRSPQPAQSHHSIGHHSNTQQNNDSINLVNLFSVSQETQQEFSRNTTNSSRSQASNNSFLFSAQEKISRNECVIPQSSCEINFKILLHEQQPLKESENPLPANLFHSNTTNAHLESTLLELEGSRDDITAIQSQLILQLLPRLFVDDSDSDILLTRQELLELLNIPSNPYQMLIELLSQQFKFRTIQELLLHIKQQLKE